MTGKAQAAVHSFPPGAPFADWLAAFILERHGDDPLALSDALVLLPTRRAVRALQDAFLRAADGRPTLLPQMRPLGDLDDDDPGLAPIWPALDAALPPAIPTLDRKLLLARLVRARDAAEGRTLPAGTALRLAEALAALLDEAAIEERDLSGLEDLVPETLAGHWQEVLAFLDILRTAWPSLLEERGQLDPAARRSAVLHRLAESWRTSPPRRPVYAAGSTGSIPATADLLACVARLPQGAVILPGLDLASPDADWDAIGTAPTHPQFMLHRLLDRLEVPRDAVREWRPAAGTDVLPAAAARAALARTALAPADRTDLWSEAGDPPAAAFDGLQRLQAATAAEEAGAIALMMREALEHAGRTVALVTPDRALARRVAAALERWDLAVDDSAGTPLSATPPAVFLRLVAATMAADLTPVTLLSVLKHPLARLGRERQEHLRLARLLERRALRGGRPSLGLAGLREAAAPAAAADDGLAAWLDDLAAAIGAAAALRRAAGPVAPATLLDAHLALAEALAAEDRASLLEALAGDPHPAAAPPPASRIWAGEAGNALAALLAGLRAGLPVLDAIAPGDWPDLLDAVLQGEVVRPAYGRHPRLFIWGPLEARLQSADLMILGGLNEGSWPAAAQEDPWMSRPMRAAFGLPEPERRIGQAAHDFLQAFASGEVVLSRAEKVDGTPTVPSRWLLRLSALLDRAPAWKHAAQGPVPRWLQALDAPRSVTPARPPRPCPPVAARPRKLSATRVETWIRDPYATYARYVLGLKPLDPLDLDPSAADRGMVIHDAMERFVRATMEAWPADPAALLERMGRESFGSLLEVPHVAAFWWPRFRRLAAWFLDFEIERRTAGIAPAAVEAEGRMRIDGPAGPFELSARADRIDAGPAGTDVLDYKTGRPPSAKQVASGLSPQLPLEGAILAAGGFPGLPAAPPVAYTYVRLSGGREAGARIEVGQGEAAELAVAALEGLRRRIAAYDRPETPYLSRPRPQWRREPGDYDHLARAAEWQAEEDGE